MSFLTPLYLLGAMAIALPVLFHLIRRTTRQRTPFSSLMFLRQAPPRLTKRSRLEDLLLLALRALVLGLVALGFARPFVKADTSADAIAAPPARMILLLDTSASMRRDGLWEQARQRILNLVEAAEPADRVALLAFDRRPRTLLRWEDLDAMAPAERTARVRQTLESLEPGWAETRLDQALILAAELAAEDTGDAAAERIERREVVVVTDLQRGTELDALQAYEWPAGVATRVEIVEPAAPGNAGLQLVADRRALGGDLEPSIRVRVSNSPDATRDQFRLRWASAPGEAVSAAAAVVEAYVPAGQARVFSVPLPPAGQDTTQLHLLGDTASFDDILYVAPHQPVILRVAYFGTGPDSDPSRPLFFLRRAFADTPRLSIRLDAFAPDQPVAADDLEAYALMIATEVLSDLSAQAVQTALRNGGALLFAPSRAEALAGLPALTGLDPVSASEVRPTGYALLGELDFGHPILAPFASPAYSDFSGIRFWRYRQCDPDEFPSARVPARFDSGDPALIDVPVGDGRLLLLTSGWHPDDSQLALSSKFVPILYSMLDLAGDGLSPPDAYAIGDALPVRASSGAEPLVRNPDGGESSVSGEFFTATDQPGIYQVTAAGAAASTVAVNMAPAESRTEPMPVDELAQLGVPFAMSVAQRAADPRKRAVLANTELESNQRGWRWFVLAAAAAAIVETGIAGRTARRHAQPEGAAA